MVSMPLNGGVIQSVTFHIGEDHIAIATQEQDTLQASQGLGLCTSGRQILQTSDRRVTNCTVGTFVTVKDGLEISAASFKMCCGFFFSRGGESGA
jgi:hypothetical protein